MDISEDGLDAASTLLEFAMEQEKRHTRASHRLSSHFDEVQKKKTSLEALHLQDSLKKECEGIGGCVLPRRLTQRGRAFGDCTSVAQLPDDLRRCLCAGGCAFGALGGGQ